MTPNDPQPIDGSQADSQAVFEQDTECLLYLLGELSTESRRRFEDKLATDPKLGDELLRHADLIASLSQTSPGEDIPLVPPHSNSHRWRWVAAIVSLAASVALGFQIANIAPSSHSLASRENVVGAEHQSRQPDDSTLFAEAWASSRTIGESNRDSLEDVVMDDLFDLSLEEPTGDMDSQISWMFVAIASSDEMQSEGDNDG